MDNTEKTSNGLTQLGLLGIIALVIWVLGFFAPSEFMAHFTVFVLACFVGYQVIWNVTPALHTPLMSVTNAISGIIVLGAVLQISSNSMVTIILATVSVFIATINIVGGFTVTKRMLQNVPEIGEFNDTGSGNRKLYRFGDIFYFEPIRD